MNDFNKILDKAKELEAKMKESQENIKKIRVEGISGSNSVKVILDGEGEMQKIEISNQILKEDNDNDDYSRATMRKNLGEMIRFKTENELGQEVSHTAKIVKISKIRNAQGTARRYAVRMERIWNGPHNSLPGNLRDRGEVENKLLIGRNWLEGDYLVDVSKNNDAD